MKNIKKLWISLLWCSAIFPSPPSSAAPAARQTKALEWPTFRQTASQKTVADVTAIQYLLRARGFFPRKPNGVFGPQTAAAVRVFQWKNGLKADGIVAASTLSRLVVRLKRGDEGDGVRAMQTILKYDFTEAETFIMPPVEVNGHFGPQTERAFHVFQKDYGLKVGDVVGVRTWAFLFDGDANSGIYD